VKTWEGAVFVDEQAEPEETALGHSEKLARASVRFGIGRFNTVEEIDKVAQHFISTVESLRKQAVIV
ncbi:MAG: hypothetical protein AAFR37_21750, partial [Cyanobacteria bacterium J06628_3]